MLVDPKAWVWSEIVNLFIPCRYVIFTIETLKKVQQTTRSASPWFPSPGPTSSEALAFAPPVDLRVEKSNSKNNQYEQHGMTRALATTRLASPASHLCCPFWDLLWVGHVSVVPCLCIVGEIFHSRLWSPVRPNAKMVDCVLAVLLPLLHDLLRLLALMSLSLISDHLFKSRKGKIANSLESLHKLFLILGAFFSSSSTRRWSSMSFFICFLRSWITKQKLYTLFDSFKCPEKDDKWQYVWTTQWALFQNFSGHHLQMNQPWCLGYAGPEGPRKESAWLQSRPHSLQWSTCRM